MTSLLLHSGKTDQYRALGETGQPVYYSALQLRKAIARRLKGRERHLAIPQRDQQGEGVDWYSGIEGDVVPWQSATEGEREDARIQLASFQKEIQAVEIPEENQGGDRETFARLLKWACHFPDENFVYLVNGTPVLTFWGFTHPESDRHANPLQCLYPQTEPELAPTIPPAISPLAAAAPLAEEAVAEEPTRPWWRRLWWLLPLALLLGLLLLLLGLRACSHPAKEIDTGINLSSGDVTAPSFAKPTWQGWAVWPFKTQTSGVSLPNGSLGLNGGFGLPTFSSGAGALDWALPDNNRSLPNAATETRLPDVNTSLASDETPLPDAEGELFAAPELSPAEAPWAPVEMSEGSPETMPPAELGPGPELLSLPANTPDGAAAFLNGDWRGAGVMDSQSGRPLQVRYAFDQGQGQMQIRRGGANGMNCTGPVAATMQDGELHVEAKERARCEDGSHYEMPRMECRQAEGEIADCAASYDDESFPMQLQHASE